MNDNNAVELDEETLSNLDELAKEAGVSTDEYLRLLLLERASVHLKGQETGRSLFLP